MLAYWPGMIAPNSQSDHLSAFWDVLPTMAELTGQAAPEDIDGISFLPSLLAQDNQAEHDYLYWEFHAKVGRVALRQGKWKAVRYDIAKDPNSTLELYDLSTDPGESNNVAAQHPELVAKLDALIQSARTPSPMATFNFPKDGKKSAAASAHLK